MTTKSHASERVIFSCEENNKYIVDVSYFTTRQGRGGRNQIAILGGRVEVERAEVDDERSERSACERRQGEWARFLSLVLDI